VTNGGKPPPCSAAPSRWRCNPDCASSFLLTLAAAQKQGISVSVAQIDPEFEHPSRGAFDPEYMKALFDFAVEQAKKGKTFETADSPEHRSDVAR